MQAKVITPDPPPLTVHVEMTAREASLLRFVMARDTTVVDSTKAIWPAVDADEVRLLMSELYAVLDAAGVPCLKELL